MKSHDKLQHISWYLLGEIASIINLTHLLYFLVSG